MPPSSKHVNNTIFALNATVFLPLALYWSLPPKKSAPPPACDEAK